MLAYVQSLLLSCPVGHQNGFLFLLGPHLAQGEPSSYRQGVGASTLCPSATLHFSPLSARRALPETCGGSP